jgi:catechol 2,3-dioxygenase-like lactoylglutathione lyase family enzyme
VAGVIRVQHVSVPMPADGHAQARRFYGDVLGMKEIPQPSTLAQNSVVWFSAGPDGQEIHCFVDDPFKQSNADQHLCLQVDDLEACRQTLQSYDITSEETTPIRNRPRFFVHDPFGNRIEIAQIQGQYD